MERCPNCGASIRTGARFCTACGFRLLPASDAPVAPPTTVEPTATGMPVPVTETCADEASSSGSGRVVWHGDPHPSPVLGDDTHAVADDSGQSDWSSAGEDVPSTGSDDVPTTPADEAAVAGAFGSWPSAGDLAGTETTMSDQPGDDASIVGPTSASDDAARSSPDSAGHDGQEAPGVGEAAGFGQTDDERPDIEQHPGEDSGSSLDVSNRSTDGDTTGEMIPSKRTDVTDAADDHWTEIEAQASRPEAAISTDPEAYGRDDLEPAEHGPDDTDVAADTASMSARSDGVGWGAESDTAGQDGPAVGSVAWQDDVVIDTSFMAETDQPGYYDANGERLSLTGEVERAADPEAAAPDTAGDAVRVDHDPGTDTGAPDDDAATRSPALVDESDTPAGRDDDWEPWGSGGMDDPDSAGDRPGAANGLPIDQTDRHAGDQIPDDAGRSGVARARTLLEQLRTAIDSLEHSAAPLAPDPRAELAIGSVAEIGQILDGLPSAAIEADRLAELTRLAEDLTGRDYDIRALQRFAQERETILTLATEVQQQRDVIDQIRSVVAQSQLESAT